MHQELRGARLREVRRQALEQLNRHDVSTTLVVTVKKGLNDGELGAIIEYALAQPCVRGVTFQPIQDAGRLEDYDPATNRLTLTEVRRRILEQNPRLRRRRPDSGAVQSGLPGDGLRAQGRRRAWCR